MDNKTNQILNMLNDLSSQDLQRVFMRAKVLSEKKRKEEEEFREQERLRQERIAQEKRRQEEIAELQRKIQELQNQEIIIPEESCKAKGSNFVMYDVSEPADNAKAAPSEPAPEVRTEQKSETIVCPNCHQSNTADSGFCLNCGYKLSKPEPEPQPQAAPETEQVLCPNCHTMNPIGSAFCLSCGQKISQPQPQTEPKPDPAPISGSSDTALQICYADESMKKWEKLPGEKTVLIKHETAILQPDKDKKYVHYMEITNKRILLTRESSVSKNSKIALGVGGGLVGALIAEGISAASGDGLKPYFAIPLAAITDCGLQSKKEFYISAGQTFVFKNNGYEKLIPNLVREAKMQ